jgi:hypothetical protein
MKKKKINFILNPYVSRILEIFLYLIYLGALIIPHSVQVSEMNAYIGMKEWAIGVYGYMFLFFCVGMSVFLLFRKYFVPSDFFVILYFLIVITPFFALYSASGFVSEEMIPIAFVILALPLLPLLLIKTVSLKFLKISLLSEKHICYLLLVLVGMVTVITYFKSPSSAGFGIQDSYERRIEGRDIYKAKMIISYFISMSVNMFTPFFAFWAGTTKNYFWGFVSVILALFFFWLLGIKSVFLYIVVAYAVGYLLRGKKSHKLSNYLLTGMAVLLLVFSLEWWANEYSLVADYFFRRLFSSAVQLQGYYLDLILNNPPRNWDWLTGSIDKNFAVTYYVGGEYLGKDIANANTNTFLYAFGQGGLVGYLLAVIIVSAIFLLFDSLYHRYQSRICFYVSFMFATLLLEQGYSTALLSSGVALMAVLVFLSTSESSYRLRLAEKTRDLGG